MEEVIGICFVGRRRNWWVDGFGSVMWKSNKKKFSFGKITGEVVRCYSRRYERYSIF